MKKNCWEFKNCGRQPGGNKVMELGICPASTEEKVNGVNGGENGGRCCWAVAGTLCRGKTYGLFAENLPTCFICDFYKMVEKEEGENLVETIDIHTVLH